MSPEWCGCGHRIGDHFAHGNGVITCEVVTDAQRCRCPHPSRPATRKDFEALKRSPEWERLKLQLRRLRHELRGLWEAITRR